MTILRSAMRPRDRARLAEQQVALYRRGMDWSSLVWRLADLGFHDIRREGAVVSAAIDGVVYSFVQE